MQVGAPNETLHAVPSESPHRVAVCTASAAHLIRLGSLKHSKTASRVVVPNLSPRCPPATPVLMAAKVTLLMASTSPRGTPACFARPAPRLFANLAARPVALRLAWSSLSVFERLSAACGDGWGHNA